MIVAGAGIVGLACAWRLARRGFRVTIFEAREAGSGASWAGAGMLAPGGEIDRISELAPMSLRSLLQYPDFIRVLEEETGASIDFQQCGAFEIAADGAEADALRLKAARQQAIGISSEPCRYGAFDARFYPGDAIVDPRDVTAALRAACLASGVELREHEPVVEIAPDGSWVRTAREKLEDEGVLVAAGAWSSQLCSGLPRSIPVRGHLVAWDLAPGTLTSIVRHGHTYLLQRRSGALIAGSSSEDAGFDQTIDYAIVNDIRDRAARLLPLLASTEPTACWNGLRPGIEGCVPLIGRIGPKLWAAYGHYRNGILLAPETARQIAESIAASI